MVKSLNLFIEIKGRALPKLRKMTIHPNYLVFLKSKSQKDFGRKKRVPRMSTQTLKLPKGNKDDEKHSDERESPEKEENFENLAGKQAKVGTPAENEAEFVYTTEELPSGPLGQNEASTSAQNPGTGNSEKPGSSHDLEESGIGNENDELLDALDGLNLLDVSGSTTGDTLELNCSINFSSPDSSFERADEYVEIPQNTTYYVRKDDEKRGLVRTNFENCSIKMVYREKSLNASDKKRGE